MICVAAHDVRYSLIGVPLYQYKFDAIVDLVFNSGSGTFAGRLGGRHTRSPSLIWDELEDGDYQAAAEWIRAYHAGSGLAWS